MHWGAESHSYAVICDEVMQTSGRKIGYIDLGCGSQISRGWHRYGLTVGYNSIFKYSCLLHAFNRCTEIVQFAQSVFASLYASEGQHFLRTYQYAKPPWVEMNSFSYLRPAPRSILYNLTIIRKIDRGTGPDLTWSLQRGEPDRRQKGAASCRAAPCRPRLSW